jgi:hypothetical protein
MDEPTAGRTNAAKVASGVGQRDIFGHIAVRLFGRATRQAVGFSGLKVPPSRATARLQKGGKRHTFEDDRALAIDRFEALFCQWRTVFRWQPKSCAASSRVGSMDLDPTPIESALAHRIPHERSDVDFCGAPMRDCVQVSRSAGA